jgi:hypothetical protein
VTTKLGKRLRTNIKSALITPFLISTGDAHFLRRL